MCRGQPAVRAVKANPARLVLSVWQAVQLVPAALQCAAGAVHAHEGENHCLVLHPADGACHLSCIQHQTAMACPHELSYGGGTPFRLPAECPLTLLCQVRSFSFSCCSTTVPLLLLLAQKAELLITIAAAVAAVMTAVNAAAYPAAQG